MISNKYMIVLQRLTFGQTGSMLFRKAVYPAKNGVSRMESHSLHWVTGSESSSQKQLRQKVLLIRCLQSSLRNMNSISVQQIQENLL